MLLLLVFRAVLAPIVTLLPAGLALAVAQPIIAESTKIGVQVAFITQILLIVLVLGAGTDYGLFLVFRVREELRKGYRAERSRRRGHVQGRRIDHFLSGDRRGGPAQPGTGDSSASTKASGRPWPSAWSSCC